MDLREHSKWKNILKGNSAIFISSIIGMIFVFKYLMRVNNIGYYYDAGYYIGLAQGISENGLASFPQSIRGYVLPYILSIGLEFFSVHTGVRVISAIFNVGVMCVVIPLLLGGFNKEYSLFRVLLSLGLSILFWSGIFIYPLSETYSIFFVLLAVYFTKKIYDYKCEYNKADIKLAIYSLLAGACAYAAYNIRTIYLFSCYAIFIIIIVNVYKKRKSYLAPVIIAFILGYILIALPQIQINKTHYGIMSTKVLTQYEGEDNLFLFQLNAGLKVQFYATYIGDKSIYPQAGMIFEDKVMVKHLAKNGIEHFTSITDYIMFCIKNPILMLGVYTRHFVNCLNPMFGEMYIKDLYKPKLHLTVINFTMMFTAISYTLLLLKEKTANKTLKVADLQLAIPIILPIVLIIPGAVEERFLLVAYLLMYGYVSYVIDYKSLFVFLKKNKYVAITLFIVFFFVLYSFWCNAAPELNM